MSINLNKYNRPGIFIEEINSSVISPVITEGLINLIPGFSKKGQPNSPIYLETKSDASAIIGSIDRNLEKKGSYLHRSVYKMLESGPVWALNLLLTDDNLDKLEYKTISTSSVGNNSETKDTSYRRFFNTSSFWRRDTESFLNFASDDNVLNFTSFRDKTITVFAIKSNMVGFDVTVQKWYENSTDDQIPSFLRSTDLISDYNIRVVVVSGDWNDYNALSVDSKYSSYFNSDGLRKNQLNNFLNDNSVTVLGDYEGSLIPYFLDSQGKDMFIENLINLETDRTGLFCSYDFDLVETDFPNKYLDLIGNTLVEKENDTINFLSYNETITEKIGYEKSLLDKPGNTLGNISVSSSSRTNNFSEGYVHDTSISITSSTSDTPNIEVVTGSNAYHISNGNKYDLNAGTLNVPAPTVSTPAAGFTGRYDVIYLDSDGFKIISGAEANDITTPNPIKPQVPANSIVICYVLTNVDNTGTATNVLTSVSVNSAYKWMDSSDITTSSSANDVLEMVFSNTAGIIKTNQYEEYRRVKMFNDLVTLLTGPNSDKAVILDSNGDKHSIKDASILIDESSNKSIVIDFSINKPGIDINSNFVSNREFLIYAIDDEFILGTGAALSPGMKTKKEIATSTEGVVAKYSDLYLDYKNGVVNTGDYFWEKLVKTADPVNFTSSAGKSYLIISNSDNSILTTNGYGNSGDKLFIESSVRNNGLKTIVSTAFDPNTIGLIDPNTSSSYTSGTHTVYELNEQVLNEYVQTPINICKGDEKVYLQFFIVNDTLIVNYTNSDSTSEITIDIAYNANFNIYSNKSNFKQTLEIENPVGYIQTPNKVLVDGSRYSEVRINDYLKAYYDAAELETGEEPKRLTRIIDKIVYKNDPTLVEITCDSKIDLTEFNDGITTDLQTTRYTSIDKYVNTYKGIKLKGFRIRQDSLPNGTEERQNEILNLMDSDTNLGKALIDRNSISWRYLIDGFGLGLTAKSKQQYVNICGARLNVLGFINMPSLKSFKNSSSPNFTDNEGNLVVEFIKIGANPESNPAFRYSFGTGDGQTTVGYFAPYVNVNDNNRPIDVPPAMYIATTYMRKHITRVSGVKPWTVSAGVTDGRIESINRLEQDFLPEDIVHLNEMGANPLMFNSARNVHYIETENTAQQQPKSSLSYLHSRELLIELENAMYNMLLDFQWKVNNAEIRADIKFRADAICQKFVDQKGLFNYSNVIDKSNNTNDIIDRQIGVLDTYVEISKNMGIIVNNINVLKTGSIESGGFKSN